jgi:hypothetical protein
MSDLINRKATINTVINMRNRCGNDINDFYDLLIESVKVLPSAEPKTGKWILDPDGIDWNIPAWSCSECGFMATHIKVEPNDLGGNPLNWAGSKFCPQCGARITGYERWTL